MNDDQYDGGPDDEAEDDLMDLADEVAYADTGRPWGASLIRHPSHAATRKHFAANPLPAQADRRSA